MSVLTLEEVAEMHGFCLLWDIRMPESYGWERAVAICNAVDTALWALWALDGFLALGFTYRELAVVREAEANGR